jgi:hypothetical protein
VLRVHEGSLQRCQGDFIQAKAPLQRAVGGKALTFEQIDGAR